MTTSTLTPRPQPTAQANARPVDQTLAKHVAQGLGQAQKSLSSALFYDDEGSRLFQQIMALPEYYLTRVEHEILRTHGDALARWMAPERQALSLIELGSGDGEKTLDLCQALLRQQVPCVFHPMDLSELALQALQQRFANALPGLTVQPLCGDYFLNWPRTAPGHRQAAMFMGSNLGNLTHVQAVGLLKRIHAQLRPGDVLLLGLDLMKDPHTILAAYDDPQGITAQFNLNLLKRLNLELGMDFNPARFRHYACYSPLDGAARSFLVSQRAQRVRSQVLDREFSFAEGETIYTEQSQKYSSEMVAQLAQDSGFSVNASFTDARDWYTVVVMQA